jgi:hypothetical protein
VQKACRAGSFLNPVHKESFCASGIARKFFTFPAFRAAGCNALRPEFRAFAIRGQTAKDPETPFQAKLPGHRNCPETEASGQIHRQGKR